MSNIAIKKIDKLLLRTFITTFILLLALVLFVMVIQTFFSLFHSLAGKGLGTGTYARLLFYLCLNIFPNAFPIAVLMASLIVFGNFSESFELTAMRSIGLSLERTLRFPFFFVLFLSGALFYFQHYIHPNSKHKIFSLVMDVLEKKSALFIREGIFCNNIPGYSIRVDKKPAGSDSVKGIIIYDYTQRYGVVSITVAEEGRLYTTSDEGYLVMELINGHNYIEPLPAKNSYGHLEQTTSFYRSTFSTQKIKISLGALQLGQTTDNYAHDPRTRTRPHLKKMIQTRTEEAMEQCQSNKTFLTEQAMPYHAAEQQGRALSTPKIESLPSPRQATNQDMDFIAFRDRIIGRKKASDVAESYDYRLQRVVEKALRSVKKVTATLVREQDIRAERKRNLNDALYQQAHRCSAALQCVIMFLLAAPLGCIIRRGGFGISVVISSFFILLDYTLTIFGKECAIVGTLSTFTGAWLPNLVLLPFCCFFLLNAEQGRGLFSTDWYALYIKIKRSAKQKISRAPKGQI